MRNSRALILGWALAAGLGVTPPAVAEQPNGLVELVTIDPTLVLDRRYATKNNI